MILPCSIKTFDYHAENFSVHMVTSSEKTFFTNAFIVETENSVILIDSMMTISEAEFVKQSIISIGKELSAVIITHPHPDHYNGLSTIIGEDHHISIYGTEKSSEVIINSFDDKEKKWRPYFGDEWPKVKIPPNRFIQGSEVLYFDNIRFSFEEIGKGESNSDLLIKVGNHDSIIFVGDLVFNNMHSFMNDGHSSLWISKLQKIKEKVHKSCIIFTGHGEPDQAYFLIEKQISYIKLYQNEIQSISQGRSQLTDDEKSIFVEIISRRYPHYKLLDFISAGANSVATEMAFSKSISI
ncbi:MBL fold metallo-hydrolase [Photobacterium sp. WH24]|uniref:MBL fold metallo-hydrolase n=1 Tax=Photobacterium sp. WH24 TaxID=2827237 RepID=UPI001C47978F|nr:MBL fold metallo-hydrolase [Photobacterium sp. WH24]MBV7263363.1 MBL fold metallo-hydrolase [Photobacterium sp. WH24]